jgi:hypothetical protein
MELYLQRTKHGLSPEDPIGAEMLEKYRFGDRLLCKITKPRNPLFHKKFFKLLQVGFNYWEPGEINSKYGKPEKNFDQFRKDVTILAGFYTVVTRLDGSVRVEPKSISFASMDEEEFERLYSNVLNVLLEKIFIGYTEKSVREMAENELLGFA